jgi:hypothetical protein
MFCFGHEPENESRVYSENFDLAIPFQKADHNNFDWKSDLSFDENSGRIILSAACLSNKLIKIELDNLFYSDWIKNDNDPGFDIMVHHSDTKMTLTELGEYKKSIEPFEKKLRVLNERPVITYIAGSLGQKDNIYRTLLLNKNESICKTWSIKELYNWLRLRDFLKQYPDIQVDIVKGVIVQVHRDKEYKEYMLKRLPLNYQVLKNIDKEPYTPSKSYELASIKINKFYDAIDVTIKNPEQKNLCYNLDDVLGKNNNEFGKRFHFTTSAEFENIKTKRNTDFFNIENPFPEDGLQRIVCLEKDECITKTIKIADLPIQKQLQSTMQKNKEEEYIIWFPIRYKKNEQMIIDFASLKVNYKSIF